MPDQPDDFNTLVRRCIEACEEALENGTPEVQALASTLLAATAQVLAKRIEDGKTKH